MGVVCLCKWEFDSAPSSFGHDLETPVVNKTTSLNYRETHAEDAIRERHTNTPRSRGSGRAVVARPCPRSANSRARKAFSFFFYRHVSSYENVFFDRFEQVFKLLESS